MIVSSLDPTIDEVCSTGYKFAGMYRIAADNSNAQVRATESGLRRCSGEPHRTQRWCSTVNARFCTRLQAWQPISPASAAVVNTGSGDSDASGAAAVSCWSVMASSVERLRRAAYRAAYLVAYLVASPASA